MVKLDIPTFASRLIEITPEFRQWVEDYGQKLVLSWLAVWATAYIGVWLLLSYTTVGGIIQAVSVICFLLGSLAGGLRLIWLHDD